MSPVSETNQESKSLTRLIVWPLFPCQSGVFIVSSSLGQNEPGKLSSATSIEVDQLDVLSGHFVRRRFNRKFTGGVTNIRTGVSSFYNLLVAL